MRSGAGRRLLRRGLLVTGAGLGLLATAGLAVFGYAQFENRQIVTLPVPTGDAQVGRVIYD